MAEKSITASILWDRFGLSVSTICAVHCLFFPVLIAILPVASATFMHELAHPIFAALIAPTVYFASRRSHYDKKITGLLMGGFALILIGWLVGHYLIGLWFETGVTVAGSIVLIWGHWLNYRHHRTCNIASHKHHPVASDPDNQQEKP
ncbi:MerC domain-containing protein [Rhodohalobacter mucosus]|uniref:MerC domain-containing protein n=1 Tax=Rhodohalobacter mucosus TaxID=2079485 RepID=UPI001304BF67|nr:MerC domain-containing protein [Rhodohalobacter mucosus]